MKKRVIFGLAAMTLLLYQTCAAKPTEPSPAPLGSWETTKARQLPKNEMPGFYATPFRQSMASMVWEDGAYITRDGMTLYTDYFPADVFKGLLDGNLPIKTYLYRRGPDLGQDFSNPIGLNTPWLHSDIGISNYNPITRTYSPWRLSAQRGKTFNRGGPQGILNKRDPSRFDYFVYTVDGEGHITIMMLRNTDRMLNGTGQMLPANVDNPDYNEDNPHIEYADENNPKKLVLFFDSENWPGAEAHDIFYTLSNDGGDSWTDPVPAKSLNTEVDEEQPHLFHDGVEWWMYFTASNPADGKLAIYRARQAIRGNWDSWVDKQLVISAGGTMGVGEPTLTSNGDIAFVAVTHNVPGGETDQYDSDPWFMPRKR